MRLAVVFTLVCGCSATVEPADDPDAGSSQLEGVDSECALAGERLTELECGYAPDAETWLGICRDWVATGILDTACVVVADDCIDAGRCAN